MPATSKPPLGLAVEIKTANGTTYRWGDGSPGAGNVPVNVHFSTRLGDGFADGGCTLMRRIDRDYFDVNLLDDFTLFGMDGATAYEGRIGANPRSISDVHSMDIVATGWMAHSRDRKMQRIYVDRDLRTWTGPGVARKAGLFAGAFYTLTDPALVSDSATPALETGVDGAWDATTKPDSEAWYDAHGLPIASIYCAWKKSAIIVLPNGNWHWQASLSTDDAFASSDNSPDQNTGAAGPGSLTLTATTNTRVYAMVQLYYTLAGQGAVGVHYPLWWTVLAVYGNHGLTKQGTADFANAQGFYVSDMVRDVITNFCPKLNPSGIVGTTYAVQHASYLDPTDPYDVIADLNKYHRFIFGVYENKTFFYRPTNLIDYDWAIDYNDPGVTVNLQGDSTDGGVYGGIAVNFINLATGRPGRVTPLTNSALLATDPDNPAIQHGIDRWAEFTISTPVMPADAVVIGAAALLEMNTPKGQGTITVQGHVKDRAGHWQQGWKVRAGDRIAITSSTSLSDRPRLVSETSWDHGGKVLSITVEDTAQRIDAVLDRFAAGLAAVGLG